MSVDASPCWYVYILRCSDGSLYTGITTDPMRRLRQHRGEIKGGAKYTRARLPIKMVWLESRPDRSSAARREIEIKRLRANAKEQLLITSQVAEEFSC
ncbi:MAG TPA: GIY-YIG nuclease family protein [Marinobacterium sp.]|nr:GIY-YIG nuclease family protein [Marinobacterium sp.]